MKKYSLDLFDLLSKIDTKNSGFFEGLSAEDKKSFSPLVVMRWLSGTSDKSQIMLLNEFINPYVFKFGENKDLLYRLMVACADGKKKHYQWLPLKKTGSDNHATKVIMEYFNISEREAITYKSIDYDELLEMASALGWQQDELNKLRKERASTNE